MLEEPARDVRRRAEKGRLAEREKSRVAEEQVQPQAEDGEDPDLGRDHRANDERKHHDRRQQQADFLLHRIPNSPCGRTRRIAAITAKITACDASVQCPATIACATPMIRPAAIAPRRLPRPPSATTTKAMPSMSAPICGLRPRIGAVRAPAIPARNAPSANAAVKRLWISIPSSDTISLFSIPARMIAP